MYQLLLVEDEDIIRNGLRHIIEKLNLDSIQILEACDGMEAIEIAKKETPHIIITDIRMPLMDGLELISNLKTLLPEAQFIILSGFSEFDYARKAITLGVKEYLLKPINKEQLNTILHQMLEQIREQELKKQQLDQTLSAFTIEISHLQKSLLWNILNGKCSPENVRSEISDSGIQFPHRNFLLLSFRAVRFTESNQSEERLRLLETDLRDICPPAFHFISDYGYTYYLLNLPSWPHAGLEAFIHTYDQKPYPYLMGISEVVHAPEHLPALLKQCRSALDNRLFYFDTGHFFYRNFQYTGSGTAFSSLLGENILMALNKGNGEAAPFIKQFFLKLLETSEVTAEWISLNTKALKYYLFSTKLVQQELKRSRTELDESIEFFLSAAETFADFTDTIIAQMLQLEKDHSHKDTQSAAVTQAINYVSKYYAKDINLVYISNFVSMNDSYFSSLFKKTTGVGFIKYLHNVRIQNAKQLFKDPSIKIYEVAEMVGFRDDKYFHKIFKKVTGMTPSDYRNSLYQ